jgi:hypothetical protein
MTTASRHGPGTRRGAGGPRTPQGKARSSRNARRHGFASANEAALAAIRDRSEPAVLALAAALVAAPREDGRDLAPLALDLAVAERELQRVRLARAALVEMERADRADLVAFAHALESTTAINADQPVPSTMRPEPDETDVVVATPALVSLERYHQRAMARLHRARHAFEAALTSRQRALGSQG